MFYMTIACFHYSLPQKQSQRVGAIFHILHANEGPLHWHAGPPPIGMQNILFLF